MIYAVTRVSEDLDLMGMSVPAPADAELTAMARCFAEEFMRMGWTDAEIMEVFRNPFYRGPHLFCQNRGEQALRELVTDVRQVSRRP